MGSGRGHRDSRIAFDDGAKTIRFADGGDEAEATQLITLMKAHSKFAEGAPPEKSGIKFWQPD
jgi:hypothetical protein